MPSTTVTCGLAQCLHLQTHSFLSFFFAIITDYPEVQKKARGELDKVVGATRLPTFEDRDSLPYIQALLLECARWFPVVPLSLPHVLTTDDYYEGYFIPEGTIVWLVCTNLRDFVLTLSRSRCAVERVGYIA